MLVCFILNDAAYNSVCFASLCLFGGVCPLSHTRVLHTGGYPKCELLIFDVKGGIIFMWPFAGQESIGTGGLPMCTAYVI